MIILTGGEIKKAICNVAPTKIAVSYIGGDWKDFVDPNIIKTIIVSPTLGSNPEAIKELVAEIGWENVFFLDNLHAKLYIGSESAVFGSSNLSMNGLGGDGLIELCAKVSEKDALDKLNEFFGNLYESVKRQTKEEKIIQLKKLKLDTNKAITHNIVKRDDIIIKFENYSPLTNDEFYVLWYRGVTTDFSPEVQELYDRECINYSINLHQDDKPDCYKWALVWKINIDNSPHATAFPYWQYIHEIYPDGYDDIYSTVAIERIDKGWNKPNPPFELNGDLIEAFKAAVQEPGIKEFLIQPEAEYFVLEESFHGLMPLIASMKNHLQRKSSK